MKVYQVTQGTIGTVYFPRPSSKRMFDWAVKEDRTFQDHEMIFDPIALANGRLKDVSSWCRSQAKKGLAGFRRDGFLLVVKYADVNVM